MNRCISVIVCIVAIIVAGCQKSVEEILVLSKTQYTTGSDGGKFSLNVTHSADYTVTVENEASSWLTAETNGEGKNTIIVNIAPNETPDQRTGRIVVKMGTLTEYVSVTQAQKNTIVISDSAFEVECEAGEFSVKIGSNVEYKMEVDASWVSLLNTKAYTEENLVFSYAANRNAEPRTAKISFKSGNLEEVVTLTQKGRVKEYALRVFHENMSFTIPEFVGSVVSGTIDWGDGSTTAFSQSASHDYVSLQEYCVEIAVKAGVEDQIVSLKDVVGVRNIDLTGM